MSDVFSIASDFTSKYEDESQRYFNPSRNTWTAYADSLAKGLPTVGPGLTGMLGDLEIIPGKEYSSDVISQEFKKRSMDDYNLLKRNLGDSFTNLNANQQASIMSLLHNVGSGNLLKSKAFEGLKEGDLEKFMYEAFDPEVGFVRASGKTVPGLQRRRQSERDLFLTDMAENAF